MHLPTMAAHLWRAAKRAVAITSIGLVVGVLAVPQASLAAGVAVPTGPNVVRPADGVGDSPVMP